MLLIEAQPDAREGEAGPDQGVIQDARRRQRLRRTRVALGLLAAVAVLGVLVSLISGGGGHRGASLHLPPEVATKPSHDGPGGVAVTLSPDLDGADAGWCMTELGPSGGGGGTCGPLPTRAHPLLAETQGWSVGERFETTVMVAGPSVASVRVNGTRDVATAPLPTLPYGMRVAVIHSPLQKNRRPRLLHLAALNASRRPAVRAPDDGTGIHFEDWNRPQPQADGICRLTVTGWPAAVAEWGQVASAIRGYEGQIVGRGFLSCVDTEYYVPGRGMRAAVLLDAAAPDHSLPAPIPGLEPVTQAPGIYNGGAEWLNGPMTARREGKAWIVVSGGGRGAEEARIRLLRDLSVTIGS